MHFTKMHGLGNDYLFHFGELENPQLWAKKLSHRHFGIGSDGIITISKSKCADFKMRIFNADGSEAMMCGNGIRCVGKYLFDKGYTDKRELFIETLSGNRQLFLSLLGKKVNGVTVNMGKCVVGSDMSIETSDGVFSVVPVSVGNPHAVCFCENAEEIKLEKTGFDIEHAECFENGVNVEFVSVNDRESMRMRVWERGSGITMACGTGACASVAAAVAKNKCDIEKDIAVYLDGGRLFVKILQDGTAFMTGPAELICECEVEDI